MRSPMMICTIFAVSELRETPMSSQSVVIAIAILAAFVFVDIVDIYTKKK